MRASKITYAKLVNLGNYEHERFEVEIELNKNEKASDAMDVAKKFIENQIKLSKITEKDKEKAIEIYHALNNELAI